MIRFAKKLLYFVIVIIALIFLNKLANLTYYNPAVIVPFYGWLDKYKLAEPAGKIIELGQIEDVYPLVSVWQIQDNLFSRPRAAVIGTVQYITRASDGDTHINIKDLSSDRIMITEMVPEYPLPLPKLGDKIKIWGVTRFDLDHRWWELHPVFGWEKIQ